MPIVRQDLPVRYRSRPLMALRMEMLAATAEARQFHLGTDLNSAPPVDGCMLGMSQ